MAGVLELGMQVDCEYTYRQCKCTVCKLAVTECFKGGKELRLCMCDEFNIGCIIVDINNMFFEEI